MGLEPIDDSMEGDGVENAIELTIGDVMVLTDSHA